MAKRTTMRSSKGKKLYAVRDKAGKFKDIQTYERAQRDDMARKSKSEKKAKAKRKAKRKAKKKTKRKTARKKTTVRRKKRTVRRKARRKS